MTLPPLPESWSSLSWAQLCEMWDVKIRYGGNTDVARCAALLSLLNLTMLRDNGASDDTGETSYLLKGKDGGQFTVTPRQLAHLAKKSLPWFDFPYGDQGEKEVRDEKGHIVKERREPVLGYVSPNRDCLQLPITEAKFGGRWFALPQWACTNFTWQQYRSLQVLVPQLFGETNNEQQTINLHAQFLAHSLVPRTLSLFDNSSGHVKFRRRMVYEYNAEQAEELIPFWKNWAGKEKVALFHICFQCYQTSVQYYSLIYPLLFSESGNRDQLRDALQGEVGTINTIMKYAGYSEQQQVYDSNLPFVLDILNTMAKEAKEIEKMNSKIKRK